MKAERMPPVHPGEILYEDFMLPLELSQNQLAQDLAVPPRRINELVHGNRRLTADTALRLAKYFKQSPEFWLGIQMRYDLDVAEDEAGERIARDVKVRTARRSKAGKAHKVAASKSTRPKDRA
jgi:addiction module HigA family antidote